MMRAEHLRIEKMRRNAEMLAKEKGNKRYSSNRFKGTANRYSEFTMDFTGSILPVVPLQMNKCKMIPGSTIKARVSEEITTNPFSSKEAAGLQGSKENIQKQSMQTVGKSNERNTNVEFESMFSYTQNQVADKLNIEPNYGVVLKVANEVKVGPNIMQDSSLVTRVATGYRKSKSAIKNRTLKQLLISQEGNHRHRETDISNNMQRDLVISQSMHAAQDFQSIRATGTVPTGAVSYAKLKRSLSNQRNTQAKIIVQRDALAMNMQLVEENSSVKKCDTNSRESTVQKRKSARQIRQRSALTSSYSKCRMPPPPIGKTLGHGLFMSKICFYYPLLN
eukprot:TRINITY_DN2192_c0_g2_i4.p1 TRINITY_DN2192_c0_g2~~TRINITY_DN2192_c0_g2_i4.p1  ORF type:complete len:335 (+),score=53.60 TRINITY_DN2192_c0_g2_i4:483-1487(+)